MCNAFVAQCVWNIPSPWTPAGLYTFQFNVAPNMDGPGGELQFNIILDTNKEIDQQQIDAIPDNSSMSFRNIRSRDGGCSLLSLWTSYDASSICGIMSFRTNHVVKPKYLKVVYFKHDEWRRLIEVILDHTYRTVKYGHYRMRHTVLPGDYLTNIFRSPIYCNHFVATVLFHSQQLAIILYFVIDIAFVQPLSAIFVSSLSCWRVLGNIFCSTASFFLIWRQLRAMK